MDWIRLNQNFKQHKAQFFWQCSLVTMIVLLTLFSLNMLSNQIVIVSIGATAFTVFTMPHRRFTQRRFILGGYLIGISVGLICFGLMEFFAINDSLRLTSHYEELFGALAVGLSIFIMVIFNAEHPPATALALALIINSWTVYSLVVTILAIVMILFARYVLRHYLVDLVRR